MKAFFAAVVRRTSNTRIATRLTLGFGVLMMFVVLVGAAGIAGMERLDRRINDIVVNNNAKLAFAQSLSRAVVEQEKRLLGLMLASHAKQREDILTAITFQRAQYADAKKGMAEIISLSTGSERETKIVAKIEKDESAAGPLVAKVIQLLGDDQTEAALKLLDGDVQKSLKSWVDDIDELVSIEQRLNDTASTEAQRDHHWLRNFTFACIALALMFGGVVAVVITRGLVGPARAVVAAANRIAGGDLTHDLPTTRRDEMGRILAAMQAMQDSLRRVVDGVRRNADDVSTASAEIMHGNNDLSTRTEEQASALEETAASMEQLGSTVKQNADNARQAQQLAAAASTVAVKGGAVVGQVVDTMKGINDSSNKIAEIIGVIDGIAFQTNILALNAAVEAARAGEQGRGFAVVASEVRSLAGRSADAAKEIKGLIAASVERVGQGTALVDQAGITMTEVVSSIKRVTDIMGEISAASSEQSAGVAQVGEAVSQMDRATQQNAALVEESAAAAESLNTQARSLVEAVAVFKLPGEANDPPTTPGIERRSPNRAKNVARPVFGKAAHRNEPTPAAAPSHAARPPEPIAGRAFDLRRKIS